MDVNSTLQAMVGREQFAHDVCALPLAQRLAALLDLDPDSLREGDALRFGWHGMLFAPAIASSKLSVDGTASDTAFLANPDGFPRRMAGGRRIHQVSPIRIGSKLDRRSVVSSIEPKSGRSGQMIVATVRHEIREADTVLMVEEIDTIFFAPAVESAPRKPVDKPQAAVRTAERSVGKIFSNIDLFRFSSAVFNSHRIHYDLKYASEVEGYPELVVNGSISALFLCEYCRQVTGWDLRKIRTRNLAPLYANSPVRLCFGNVSGQPLLWVENAGGRITAEIDILEYRDSN